VGIVLLRVFGLLVSGLLAVCGLTSSEQEVHADQSVLLRNVRTGKCADVPGFGPGTPDGPVNQYTCDGTARDNQRWIVRYEGRSPSRRLTYSISNAVDGLCLDLPDFGAVLPGTKVAEFKCRKAQDNQLFFLDRRPGTDAVWIVNLASSLCLDVDGFGTGGNDARLTLWYCSDTDDHHWRLDG
jgi:hypothetical protein